MGRFFRLYSSFVKQFFKSLLEYRADFLIGMFSFMLMQIGSVVFLYSVFQYVPEINGWNYNELLFIYGVYLIPKGLDHLFTDRIWNLAGLIRLGDLDRYLLRPINPMVQLCSEKIDPNALGEIILGIVILSISVPNLDISLTNFDIFVSIPLFILFGALIYTSVKIFFQTFSFYTKANSPLTTIMYETSEFARYPLSIYPGAIKTFLKFVIPFAFAAYYPAVYILGIEKNITILLQAVGISTLAFIISYKFFKIGLKRYESSGN